MKKHLYRIALYCTILALTNSMGTVLANPQIDSINPANFGYGGIINTHDMMMLKEKQRMLDEQEDFKNYQERKKNKNKKNESVIKDSTNEGEKIFDAETDLKLQKEKEEFLEQQEKKKKKFFFKKDKKQKNSKETEDLTTEQNEADKYIEKDETTTVIKAKAMKTQVVDGKYFIKAVAVTNSQILTDEEIQNLSNSVIGKYVAIEDLENLILDFNYLYASKGYVTARAFLPPQNVSDGIVRVSLVEGTVGKVTVENNRWTSDSYIKKRISANDGELFKIIELEQDVVKFNRYNDGVKLKANLKKGANQGETDIVLETEEKFPFHVIGLMDNAGRKTIGELRGGLMLYADSLFKQRDRLSIGSYVSRHSVTPFADYNIPVNKYDGKVGFLFSSSYAHIGEGPYKIFDIESRSFNYSLYYTHPLIRKPTFELTSYSSINYKTASTYFGGYNINRDKITSFETALNARWDTKRGIWYINQGVYQAFPIFDDASKYFKYTGSIIRLHDFGHGIVGQLRGMYQYSPQDVIPYIDQFQAGGLATIRGYSEGLLIGRSGYIISGEMLFPLAPQEITINKKTDPKKVPFVGKYVKGVVFADHAGVFPFKGEGPGAQTYDHNDYLISVGMGLRISLPGDVTARLYWGFPLMRNSHEMYYRNPRFSFELSLAPDFDKILKHRKTIKSKESL